MIIKGGGPDIRLETGSSMGFYIEGTRVATLKTDGELRIKKDVITNVANP